MKALERWYDVERSRDPAALEALLHPDAIFIGPILHTPQRGRAVTMAYLTAAMEVLGNEHFRYVGEWRSEHGAILEFTTRLGGVEVNGVDMLTFDETNRQITEFKVMLRPAKALEAVGMAMMAALGR
ncbi:nuclear transport factor 2 family protein [Sphingomicrobium flavum]|uniref:nuclear transport factor 2 family protein n=1 Tax=Sphingomicrobium flavum TaxID=1229164 RepID=UPI0021ADEBBE|nr:nuclear transport factor 2 family protein [Sphingomicrobium flavum]